MSTLPTVSIGNNLQALKENAQSIQGHQEGIEKAKEAIGEVIRSMEDELASNQIKPEGIFQQSYRDEKTAGHDRALLGLVQAEVKSKGSARTVADKLIEQCLLVPGGDAILAMMVAVSDAKGAADSGKSIFEQINLRIEPARVGHPEERLVTLTLPAQPYADNYKQLNSHPDKKQPGVWKKSRLMHGPRNEVVPSQPTEQSFTIYFNSGYKSRDQQAKFLADKGQKFANPFLVALAEATSLAKDKESLFQFNGKHYVVRTEKSEAKNGAPVRALGSYSVGVDGGGAWFVGDGRYPDAAPVVAVGSPNH